MPSASVDRIGPPSTRSNATFGTGGTVRTVKVAGSTRTRVTRLALGGWSTVPRKTAWTS